jgi:murein DD-endopeptidase MepM/ murein hydrolase activator NlpD
MWRALAPMLLAAVVSGCGFAGVNPRSSGSAPGQMGHQVAAGESIYSIANRYGTTPEAIAARNGLQPPYQLTVGQRLILPAPSSYTVQPGETMDMIARRYGTTPAELARVNGIGAPYTVVPGQTLTIPQGTGAGVGAGYGPTVAAVPATGSPVQVSELPPPGSTAYSTPGTYAATGGAATGGAYPAPPAPPVSSPVGGTAPALPPAMPATSAPAGTATGAPIPLTGTPDQPVTATVGQPQVYSLTPPPGEDPAGQTASAVAEPALPPADTPAQPASTGAADTSPPPAQSSGGGLPALSGSGFLRPVTGQVLTGFGEGSPVPNDGVNIAAPRGTPIHAAESGVVAYVGEDIDTFGNLVLIRHAEGWVTAYGHADAILVSEGDVVSRGQVIARVGNTGSVTVPQLHFELRRGTEPVDPLAYIEG